MAMPLSGTLVDVAHHAITVEAVITAALSTTLGVAALCVHMAATVIHGTLVDVSTSLAITVKPALQRTHGPLGVAHSAFISQPPLSTAHSLMSHIAAITVEAVITAALSTTLGVAALCVHMAATVIHGTLVDVAAGVPSPSKPALQRHSRPPRCCGTLRSYRSHRYPRHTR